MNICSVLVHADPEQLDEVMRTLTGRDGTEVHQVSPEGRMVITVEDTGAASAIDGLRQITALKGVLATALIYHHFEQDPQAGLSLESPQ